MLICEDYEVIEEDTKSRMLDILDLPKTVYNQIEGFYNLRLVFIHATYVEISYVQNEKILVSVRVNLSARLVSNILLVLDYLEDHGYTSEEKLYETLKGAL